MNFAPRPSKVARRSSPRSPLVWRVNIHTARACDELKAVARKRDIGNRVGPRETHGRAFLARSETALNASGDRAERRYLAGCEAEAVVRND